MSLIYASQKQTGDDLSRTNNDETNTPGACQADTQQQQSSAAEPGVDGQSEPLFQIKKWNLFAFWKWDAHSDVCAICRANVMDACPTCQSENTASECVIVWGACNHSFHNCCIVKWIKRNNRCPLCQQSWKDCKKRQLN